MRGAVLQVAGELVLARQHGEGAARQPLQREVGVEGAERLHRWRWLAHDRRGRARIRPPPPRPRTRGRGARCTTPRPAAQPGRPRVARARQGVVPACETRRCAGCCTPAPRCPCDLVLACCGQALPHGTEAAGPRAVAPYVPRAAADTVLHGVVREHLETFLAAAAARTDGVGLPRFIERELRGFLRCGLLVHGFLRRPLRRLRVRAPRAAVVQRPRGVRQLRRAAHGRAGGESRPGGPALGARPAMGPHRARTGCATASPSTTPSVGPSSRCSCAPCSAGTAGGRGAPGGPTATPAR